MSFSTCEQIPKVDADKLDLKRQKFCFKLSNVTLSEGTRPCSGGSTPPLHSVTASFISREVPLFGTDWKTVVDLGMWIGVQEETPGEFCLWMGQEQTGVCVNDCDIDPRDPSTEKVATLVDEFLRELQAKNNNGELQVPDYIFDIGFTVLSGVLVIGVLYLLGPSALLGGVAA
ncbi:hypothetical protein NKF06_07390 [Haloferax sp. AB510]|uniref:hypothetical protein n=1 Tax=Haloferax sp. AB510 TaxID=2934172 RepID=UPI00209C01F4|nr:hypothetical protein [Haloferax sp. AB510]MCO8266410.1 hypothetical protein [Haloferax sp. AB510]